MALRSVCRHVDGRKHMGDRSFLLCCKSESAGAGYQQDVTG